MAADDGAEIVVFTALAVEGDAVRDLLRDSQRCWDDAGTEYRVGRLPPAGGRVAVAEIGAGNYRAAVLADRAISRFRPSALFFVGVAGALHPDLELGDVVVGTKIYAFHGGKEADEGFLARPHSYDPGHELEQRAGVVAQEFRRRPDAPRIHFRPIAAGEVVLNSRETSLARQLRRNYNDAAAIEMESAGMATAGHVGGVPTLTVRGISDLADGAKETADASGSQPRAAHNAAEFAVAVMADYLRTPRPRRSEPADVQDVVSYGGNAYGAYRGDVYVHNAEPPRVVDWRQFNRTSRVVSRPDRAGSALELHLLPAVWIPPLEGARLRSLPAKLAACLPTETRPETGSDDQRAWAATAEPRGVLIDRSGQRSAWAPYDSAGDRSLISEQLAALIALLMDIPPTPAHRYAPAVTVLGSIHVRPVKSVSVNSLRLLADDVAAELASRLLG